LIIKVFLVRLDVMKRRDVKSRCPVNYALEIFGDPWSLLIVRGMVTYGASSYGDFLKSEEQIGTSVLAERLAHLEANGIISKSRDAEDKRRTVYGLTPAGLDVLPMLYEIMKWGTRVSPKPKSNAAWLEALKLDRAEVLTAWRKALLTGSAFYVGESSVVSQLGLSMLAR
jgi:DNA-binding HxlR family transcriptional regulator